MICEVGKESGEFEFVNCDCCWNIVLSSYQNNWTNTLRGQLLFMQHIFSSSKLKTTIKKYYYIHWFL